MADHGPEHAEGHGRENHDRLQVAAEGDGHQRVHREHRDDQTLGQRLHGFGLRFLLAAEVERQAGRVGHHVRQDVARQRGADVVAGRHRGIDVRGHGHGSAAVDAQNLGERRSRAHVGGLVQRNLASGRRADEQVLDRVDRVTLLLRQPHVHPQLVAAALLPAGLGAEERATDLCGKVDLCEPQTLGSRLELQVELRLADLEAVVDIEDTGVVREPRGHARRGRFEGSGLGVLELDRDLRAGRRTVVVVERQAVHAGEVTNPLAPAPRELGRAELPVDVRNEVGRDDRHVTAGHGNATARTERAGVGTSDPCPDPLEDGVQRRAVAPRAHSPLRHEFGADLFRGAGHQPHHLASVRHRRTEGKLDHPVGELALDLGEEVELQVSARDHTDSHDEPREEDGHGQVAVSHQPPCKQRHARGNDPLDPLGEAELEPPQPSERVERTPPPLPPPQLGPTDVPQVRGQDEHGLHQRKHQDRDDDQRNVAEELAGNAGYQRQGNERDDRRDDGEGDRGQDFPGSDDRGFQPIVATAVVEDRLADHDGVVHRDAQHQDEGEQGDHVDRHAEHRDEEERTAESDADAGTDPEGDRGPQEDAQDRDHQEQAEQPVPAQDRQAVAILLRLVGDNRQTYRVGKGALAALQQVVHRARDG